MIAPTHTQVVKGGISRRVGVIYAFRGHKVNQPVRSRDEGDILGGPDTPAETTSDNRKGGLRAINVALSLSSK